MHENQDLHEQPERTDRRRLLTSLVGLAAATAGAGALLGAETRRATADSADAAPVTVANFPAIQPVSITDPAINVNATVIGTPVVALSGGLVSTAATLIAPSTVDGQPYADGLSLAGGTSHTIAFAPPEGTQLTSLVLKNRSGGVITWNPLGAAGPFSFDLQPGDMISGDLTLGLINVYTPATTMLNNPSAPGLIAWAGVQALPAAPPVPLPTATPVLPTATATPVPPTAMPSPTATATLTTTATATAVPPTATDGPTASPTAGATSMNLPSSAASRSAAGARRGGR